MRIGIDCRTILTPGGGETAGVGHYTYFLIKHLLRIDKENEYVLFCDPASIQRIKKECIVGRKQVSVRLIPFFSIKKRLPFVYSHMFVSTIFSRQELDLLHAPANVMPLFYKRPAVVTVHDLSIYDHPEWFPGDLPGDQSFSTRVVVPHSVEAANRIIAVSESTKHDLERIFSVSQGKIDVVHEGSEEVTMAGDSSRRLSRHGLRQNQYLFCVGTLEPRKNLKTAIKAFVRAVQHEWLPRTAVLAVAGARGWKDEPILQAVAEANERMGKERIKLLGYVSHRDKVALMANARAFVFPSLYEGFGLPVVEAMRLGTPVISTNTSSLPEVCGDACILTEPHDHAAMAEAMRDIYKDKNLAKTLTSAGKRRGEMFTWEKAAVSTLEIYRKAYAESKKAKIK